MTVRLANPLAPLRAEVGDPFPLAAFWPSLDEHVQPSLPAASRAVGSRTAFWTSLSRVAIRLVKVKLLNSYEAAIWPSLLRVRSVWLRLAFLSDRDTGRHITTTYLTTETQEKYPTRYLTTEKQETYHHKIPNDRARMGSYQIPGEGAAISLTLNPKQRVPR